MATLFLIRHGRLSAVYSSPLERCVETVAPLAERQGLRIVLRQGLIEMEAGSWTNRSLAQLRRTKLWRQVLQAPSQFRFPNGEGFAEAQVRALEEMSRIAAAHPRGRVAVSTHGDIVRMLVAYYGGAHLDLFQRTIVDPAGVSVVVLDAGFPRILLVNDTGGLRRFAPARNRNLRG
jgi:broad specificity phosphatase PhoE